MPSNNDLQKIEKPTVIRCPHLEGKESRDSYGMIIDGVHPNRFPEQLVGEGNYLALCDDCYDKLMLALLRDWMRGMIPAAQQARSLMLLPR